MVYRELPLADAEQAFANITSTVEPQEPKQKAGLRKKVVKPLPRKSK